MGLRGGRCGRGSVCARESDCGVYCGVTVNPLLLLFGLLRDLLSGCHRNFRILCESRNMKSETTFLSLLDIAASGQIGPVVAGGNFAEVAPILGVPQYWGFGSETFFSSYMGFGSVEIGVRSIGDVLRIEYAKLEVGRLLRGQAKFARSIDGSEIRIKNEFTSRHPHFDEVAEQMAAAHIKFTTKIRGPVTTDTTSVMNFGKYLTFYFGFVSGRQTNRLASIETAVTNEV
jgi:hypothetical protein